MSVRSGGQATGLPAVSTEVPQVEGEGHSTPGSRPEIFSGSGIFSFLHLKWRKKLSTISLKFFLSYKEKNIVK